jgi:hypothetical protein
MQQLQRLYRSDYQGEDIITQMNLVDGSWESETEFVPNTISSSIMTSRAVAIGNGESRNDFNLGFISGHQGGYTPTRLQSYGCNGLYRDFTPDFLITVGEAISHEIIESNYWQDNIVYANADLVTKHPGKFYLIPQNPLLNAGALAVYMACFDGHKQVFLIGHDLYDETGSINNVYKDTNGYAAQDEVENGEFYLLSLAMVMQTYSDVKFIRVMPTDGAWVHSMLDSLPNFRQMDYRTFALEADLGQLN